MSSIKLKHSGGNSMSIAAPSSNPAADRTITLDDNYAGNGSFVTANGSGNVGIGTASPSGKLNLATGASTACELRLTSNNTGSGAGDRGRISIYSARNDGTAFEAGKIEIDRESGTEDKARIQFFTNGGSGNTERMRIDSNGHFGFGPHGIDPSSNGGITMRQTVISGTNKGAVISNNTIDSGQGFQEFRSSGTQIGSIGKSGTTSTTYNTSSDYRLKENESPITDGITRLKVLKPYRFNWKADASTKVDGFFAHEVTPAVPEAITGEKDAVDSNDDPIIQQIDQSKLVPLLTAALQEAIVKIETLETEKTQMQTDLTALTARVAALEAG